MTNNMKSAEWAKLCREQREAYFAWQNATSGAEHDKALAVYLAASKKQDEFQNYLALSRK